MEAAFLDRHGDHVFFKRGDKTARVPLLHAYTAYLSSKDGNHAICDTTLPEKWAVVAAHPGRAEKQSVAHVAVLPDGAALRPLPPWFAHSPTTPVPAEPNVWLSATGVASKNDLQQAALLHESQIEDQIRQRAQMLMDDTAQADTVDASRTLDGYIRLRVKRALLVLNRRGLIETLSKAQAARACMAANLLAHGHLADVRCDNHTNNTTIDAYTPIPADYNIVIDHGVAGCAHSDYQ